LDEVWDPQNFGALLRTAYFLRCDRVVVCSKNSAPLSPVVSRASAGAMEVMPVYSTDNMMKFLDKSRENGWQVRNDCPAHCFPIASNCTDANDGPIRLNRW
jgi:21S rRNA (GM2251-2'-O)-methyltransferase